MVHQAFEMAAEKVICEVESEGTRIGPGPDRRWDISAMFNPNEHAPENIDRAERDIGWALGSGLLELESGRPVVVRILKRLAQ